jgi:hypothetical protein
MKRGRALFHFGSRADGIRRIFTVNARTYEYQAIFDKIVQDPRYQAGLDWGVPRPGHPEGTIRAHIADLERTLETLRPRPAGDDYWKLKLLIHVHDTFKGEAEPDVPISHPRSHASLARAFLSEYCDDSDLLAMVQNHDVPYALYKHFRRKHHLDNERLEALFSIIKDWDLFAAFLKIDGSSQGKSPEPLHWFAAVIGHRVRRPPNAGT